MRESTGTAAEPRFLADCMLGRLARWLRLLGYDTAYERRISDEALIARGLREGRIVLTRDRALAGRRALRRPGGRWLLVRSDEPEAQLAEVVAECRLEARPGRILSRCTICNEPTTAVAREQVAGAVPPYVYRTQRRFSRCPACGRVYWRATHVESILAVLARAEQR